MNSLLRFLYCVGALCISGYVANGQAPIANFTSNIQTSCANAVIQFTDQSTNNPTSWYWDLGNGTNAIIQNPSTTYINPGVYTVVLTATNASGSNTKTRINYITINPTPTVDFFTADTVALCPPKTVNFTNLSTPNTSGTATYFWDFGDGSISNSVNPSHTYLNPGNYNVSLIVTNGAGCTQILNKNAYIRISSRANVSFTSSSPNSCTAPLTVNFTNTTTNAISYLWLFGDGGTSTAASPAHTYVSSGAYTVKLIAQNAGGCFDTLTMPNYINAGNLAVGFTSNASGGCSGSTISFTNTTTPAPGISSWNFGDGGTSSASNPSHTYLNPGIYTVKQVVTLNGCVDSTTHTITIDQRPTARFSTPDTASCTVPYTVNFNNTSLNANSYFWDFGDGGTSTSASPSHTYTSFGNYTVRLITVSPNGCRDTMIRTNYIKIISIGVSYSVLNGSGCAPTTVSFSSVVNSAVPILSYNWTFGDGGTGTGMNVSHTYTAPGTYPVLLTVTTSTGCVLTVQNSTISIGNKPTANYTYNPSVICVGQGIQFTNASGGGATNYRWDFGDGAISTATNPIHIYSAPGTYSVTLIAYNNGCYDSMRKVNIITVNNPLANFSVTGVCTNRSSFTFINTSIGATSYTWNFGDGSPSVNTTSSASQTHTFPALGIYTVTLTATSTVTGCTSIKAIPIEVFAIDPTFTANSTQICRGQSILFTASTTRTYPQYYWNFGDGNTQITTTSSVSHTYTVAGNYTVTLRLGDTVGCMDSMRRINYVFVGGSNVAFTGNPLSGCAPVGVTFLDQSVSGVAITTRTWRFGDGISQVVPSTSVLHTYNQFGTYNVTLILTDAAGCTDSLVKYNYINVVKPVASFTSSDTQTCINRNVSFTNFSTGTSGLTYAWNFGDGGTSTLANPSHVYTLGGNYTVRLIVTDATGCRDTLIRSNYIKVNTIIAGFTMSDSVGACPPLSVVFTNTTVGGVTYQWSFGNSSTSTSVNPTNIYTVPGTYTVTLRAINANGCIDSFRRTVRIGSRPTGTISYSPTSGCYPLTVTFTSTNINASSLTWDFNNGVTSTGTANTITYTYTQGGVYLPRVILSNSGGCNNSIIGLDTIRVNKVNVGFIATPNAICEGGSVSFTDTSTALTSAINVRNWAFGDGGTATGATTSHVYSTAGTYTVRLIAGTTAGCMDTAYRTVVVNPKPTIVANNRSVCIGDTVNLQASGASSYSWSPAAGLSCTSCANPTANVTATTTYTVTGTSSFGCTNTKQVTVTVNPLPAVSAGPGQSICAGTTAQLQASGANSYVWAPAATLSCAACSNPVAAPAATTTYTVTGTSTFGCVNTAQVTVTVIPSPVLNVSPARTICAGDTAALSVSGAASYTWSPATGLSCTTCANPIASPATTTTYTVLGNTVTNGCQAAGNVTVTVNPLPVVSAGANRSICTGDTARLTATGGVSYVWTPATGLSCATCANPVASPTATTTYTVTGTNANGCKSTAQVTVTVNPLPVVSVSQNQSICAGSSVALTASGATSYLWTPATGLSSATSATPTASPTATTTYTVTGTNANGCKSTAQVTVTVNPLPTITTNGNQFMCPGGSVTLSAAGAATYSWTPTTGLTPATGATVTASPAATTTYTVTGTSAAGCTGTAQVTVNVNNSPTITVTGNSPICTGGTVTLTASGAQTYSWSPATGLNTTTGGTVIASPATTTTYTVTGTSGVGCSGTTQVTVVVNPLPTVSAGANQTVCAGVSATLTATGAQTYSWSPATGLSSTTGATVTASPAATTTYTVTGTNANGCVNTAQVTVTVNPRPTITTAGQSICPGGTATLTATGGVSYTWSPTTGLNPATGATVAASPAVTTTYTVTGTGANGCTGTATATVTVNAVPNVTVTGNNTICQGTSTTLTASGASTFTWSPATGLNTTTGGTVTASPATTTTYTVTGTSGVGCSGTAQYTVTVRSLPAVTVTGPNLTPCAGTPVSLQASGASTYSWSPSTGLSTTTGATTTASPVNTTTYVVTGTDAFGCTDTGMVTVTIKPLPILVTSPDTSICGQTKARLVVSGAASYTWSPATTLSCATCDTTLAAPAVTTTYTVTGTGSNGCTSTKQVKVTIYNQPPVNAGPDQTICAGQSAQLQASGAASYTWSPAATLSCATCANPLATPLLTASYTVTGTDVHGCVDSDKVAVAVIQKGSVAVGQSGEICEGDSYQLQASGGTAYTWSPESSLNNAHIANPVASPAATTTYHVIIEQGQCFKDTLPVTVTVHPLPTIDAGPDRNIMAGTSTVLQTTGTNIATYSWTPTSTLNCLSCPAPTAIPDKTTTYYVRVKSDYGCEAMDSVTLRVTCDGSQLWVPNTFTPNGDGQNDRFYPHGKGITTVSRFRVYDRWGELIYDMVNLPVDDFNYGWDGTYKNRQLKPDVYVYIINAECSTGEPLEIKGDISLIR